ncbi:hypothetical protein BBB39_01850 [Bordetella trematum]|uniref:Uncharacterized protein n=1 Tax=Bordetella trematum TaxID=123899 RepID=A0A157SEU3_9BORD|nr:hypothetical protein [Bordetella trematum]AZR92646.1 hypothetical protein BBB39_01850 [Bordetella trematum]NNH19647.1 hypothetical protein [Bordetella trematum]SAI54876.1 Uncharacterised protein [Bordetella trematum]SAI68960.1 Uncharacterised protein [Bordetella trematum]SUV99487.1 Uncharacterised protein [Bordetella trematum]
MTGLRTLVLIVLPACWVPLRCWRVKRRVDRAEVLGAHIMDACGAGFRAHVFDPAPMDLVARLQNPGWYGRIAQPFQLPTPSPQPWEAMKRAGATTEYLERG